MADLRDIFRYVNAGTAQEHGTGDNAYAVVNNTDLRDEDFYAQLQALQGDKGSFQYERGRTAQGDLSNNFNIRPGSFLDQIGQQYGSVNFGASPYSEGSPGRHLSIDASKMPRTRFGDISRAAAVDQGTELKDPSMVYNDPRYGRITHQMNVRGNPELEMGVQAAMAAATGGMAMLGAPAIGTGLVNAARAAGSGNWQGALGGALGMIPGMSPLLAGALRMGLNATRGRPANRQQALAAAMRRYRGGR